MPINVGILNKDYTGYSTSGALYSEALGSYIIAGTWQNESYTPGGSKSTYKAGSTLSVPSFPNQTITVNTDFWLPDQAWVFDVRPFFLSSDVESVLAAVSCATMTQQTITVTYATGPSLPAEYAFAIDLGGAYYWYTEEIDNVTTAASAVLIGLKPDGSDLEPNVIMGLGTLASFSDKAAVVDITELFKSCIDSGNYVAFSIFLVPGEMPGLSFTPGLETMQGLRDATITNGLSMQTIGGSDYWIGTFESRHLSYSLPTIGHAHIGLSGITLDPLSRVPEIIPPPMI